MGYTTYFNGTITSDREFSEPFIKYINDFNRIKHMKRDIEEIKRKDPKWMEHCFDGNLGPEGAFYIGNSEPTATSRFDCDNIGVVDYNKPPTGCPGLWCDWKVDDCDKQAIVWDGAEKFYNYTEWMIYIIENFCKPAGYVLNGEIFWEGEDPDDKGKIKVVDNVVKECLGTVVYDDDEDVIEQGLRMCSQEQLEAEVKRRFLTI